MTHPTDPGDITNAGIEVTPDLLATLKAELSEVFDCERLEVAYRKRLDRAGTREYAWVNRPEIPLLLQAYRDCDIWIAALRRMERPHNTGALGPFVRLGMALRFAGRLSGGPERIGELHRHALGADFDQLTNKAFELEVAFYFAQTAGRDDISFGPLGGKPDLWLAPSHPLAIPVECKVVSGGRRPSKKCLGEWRQFIIWAVQQMRRRRVAAGICARANDDFGPSHRELLRNLAEEVLAELEQSADETWSLRSDAGGEFLVYGYRLCEWGKPRPPFSVPLGLDGDLAVWTEYDTKANTLHNPYFFALRFQTPELKADAVVDNVKLAADQLKGTRPEGPGLAVLKVGSLRMGDLFEIDRSVRAALSRREHVSAVLLLWDESAEVPDGTGRAGAKVWGFGLKPYLIVNQHAHVSLGWPDSRPTFFTEEPRSIVRAPSGELVPYDFEVERRLIRGGTVIPNSLAAPWLINAPEGKLPPFPHVLSEGPEITEPTGRMTFYWRFRQPLADSLFPLPEREILLEWFVVGSSHFRIYRDRHLNLRINRRTASYQDNVAIDLVPVGTAEELLLHLCWDGDVLTASLRWSDERSPAFCRSARSPLD